MISTNADKLVENKSYYGINVQPLASPTSSSSTPATNNPAKISDIDYLKDEDVALNAKLTLVNDALDEIGFTYYHLGLFCLAGFGYAADSLIAMINGITQTYAITYQYGNDYPLGTQFSYFGLFVGAICIGFTSDLIGRRIAFNCSLILSACFGILTGGTSSLPMYCFMIFMTTFFLGGNLALDVTLLMEFLPFKYQYLNTFMACWWGIGQTVTELIGWAFLPNFSCSGPEDCSFKDNRGWRYTWYVSSAVVLVMGLARVLLFKLHETPKYLISNKRDYECVKVLQDIATKHNRTCSLTLEQLEECGEITINEDFMKNPGFVQSLKQIRHHIGLLFYNKTVARSNILIITSWFGIGITYGIYSNFLYAFLSAHGADTGTTTYEIYRDATLECFFSIFGPIIAAYIMLIPNVGRKGTMLFGGLSSMIVLLCYVKVRSEAANVVVSSLSYVLINLYYGTLYAYTPEALPSPTRATGASLALAANRVAGMLVPVIYYFSSDSSSAAPIYVCGVVIGIMGIIAMLMPFEPTTHRSV